VATQASAAPVPSGLNRVVRNLIDPTSSDAPTMPLQVIITAENTVSRASVAVFSPPEIISVTISATSITVTATASSSDPYGSPTLCATTSAWCTADSTAALRSTAITTTSTSGMTRPQVPASATAPITGAQVVHLVRVEVAGAAAMPHPPRPCGTGPIRAPTRADLTESNLLGVWRDRSTFVVDNGL